MIYRGSYVYKPIEKYSVHPEIVIIIIIYFFPPSFFFLCCKFLKILMVSDKTIYRAFSTQRKSITYFFPLFTKSPKLYFGFMC